MTLTALASGAKAADYRQEFPYSKVAVYRALVETLPAIGYTIKAQDPVINRVTASAGMSAWSFGENLSLGVTELGPDRSELRMDGELKMATNVFARGRMLKHFDKIILAVSGRLQLGAEPRP